MPRGCSVNDPRRRPRRLPNLPADIVKDFIRLDIRVCIGHLDRVRMRIEHPRRECADDEAVGFERLMNRRRLVDRPGDRFKVVGVEGERIDKAIPTNDVEWMVRLPHNA